MNLVEYAKITKCLSKLDKLEVADPKNLENLEGAKAILEDLIEFKIFPKTYLRHTHTKISSNKVDNNRNNNTCYNEELNNKKEEF